MQLELKLDFELTENERICRVLRANARTSPDDIILAIPNSKGVALPWNVFNGAIMPHFLFTAYFDSEVGHYVSAL